MAPAVVIRPIEPVPLHWLMNHKAPSGPSASAVGSQMSGLVKAVISPLLLIRTIDPLGSLVNHSVPPGPAVMPWALTAPPWAPMLTHVLLAAIRGWPP